jgi:hypothetical protein
VSDTLIIMRAKNQSMSAHNADDAASISEVQKQFEELARQKESARARLNAMPADAAQKRVSAILHPELWSVQVPASWGERHATDTEY